MLIMGIFMVVEIFWVMVVLVSLMRRVKVFVFLRVMVLVRSELVLVGVVLNFL